MSDKQATVYIVDLGSSIGECSSGRVESDLDYGMRYIWDKIATTMSANLKGWNIGVIGFRTDETNNPLDSDGYKNISVSISLRSPDTLSISTLSRAHR
jgi:ATP-dependent DNA helicase 2 subunit 2